LLKIIIRTIGHDLNKRSVRQSTGYSRIS